MFYTGPLDCVYILSKIYEENLLTIFGVLQQKHLSETLYLILTVFNLVLDPVS